MAICHYCHRPLIPTPYEGEEVVMVRGGDKPQRAHDTCVPRLFLPADPRRAHIPAGAWTIIAIENGTPKSVEHPRGI